ncbi:DUF3800 domain-containing protein [uncultured Christiangramia sp.]|uniref:DUF3800 domain-containing protein n=1 Tax=uncultured Christiangramia sp. TaxID=503836 RepID=UPI00262AC862|nr:DUF3800 domain-containing protein [uncultured Christiangramia sp.]
METQDFDIFIDESCHLENDHKSVMGIGYCKVPHVDYEQLKKEIQDILVKHNQYAELKWNKFSTSRLSLYKELVDYFFKSSMEFRAILVKYKDRLNHEDFNQGSHDNFYYKMIYFLLRPNGEDSNKRFRVFIDLKDTRGREKLNKIREVFDNAHKGESPFIYFQHIQSHDNLFLQIADFFIGAVTYKNRVVSKEFEPTKSKLEFINYLEEVSGFCLNEGTVPWEKKFNIFDHQPKKRS